MADPVNSSDEAVEAALAACNAPDVLDLRDALTKAFPIFAAAVRAEAIDDFSTHEWAVVARAERTIAVEKAQREAVQQVRHDMELLADRVEDYTPEGVRIRLRGYATQLEHSLAAGSVPVATPDPVQASTANLESDADASSPVATPPAEPAAPATCEHGKAEGHPFKGTYGLARWCPGPPVEDETPTGKIGRAEAEALRTKAAPIDLLASLQANLPPAPSQPVTCEHGSRRGHQYKPDHLRSWTTLPWCPGPVSVPKESSE